MAFGGKYARLSKGKQKIRLSLLDWAVTNGGEIPHEVIVEIVESVMASNVFEEFQGKNAEEIISSMEKEHIFQLSESEGICYLYPYSAYPTDYDVRLADGRRFFAMCAIDSMGSAVTFEQPVEIFSKCKDTKEEIFLRVTPQNGIETIKPDDKIIATYYDTSEQYIAFNC